MDLDYYSTDTEIVSISGDDSASGDSEKFKGLESQTVQSDTAVPELGPKLLESENTSEGSRNFALILMTGIYRGALQVDQGVLLLLMP